MDACYFCLMFLWLQLLLDFGLSGFSSEKCEGEDSKARKPSTINKHCAYYRIAEGDFRW